MATERTEDEKYQRIKGPITHRPEEKNTEGRTKREQERMLHDYTYRSSHGLLRVTDLHLAAAQGSTERTLALHQHGINTHRPTRCGRLYPSHGSRDGGLLAHSQDPAE